MTAFSNLFSRYTRLLRSTQLPIIHDRALLIPAPATASLPPSSAAPSPCPRPAATSSPNKDADDLSAAQRCPSLIQRETAEIASSAAGVESSSLPPAGSSSVEMTWNVPSSSGGGGADRIISLQSVAGNGGNNIASTNTSRVGTISIEIEKRKKGILSSIHTMTERLHTGVLAIFALYGRYMFFVHGSKQYIYSDYIAVIFMAGNILGTIISSCVLSPLASYMKESESTEVLGHGVFIGTLLIVGLAVYYYNEFCITLPVVASTPVWVAWILAIIGSCLILLVGVWFIYIKLPKIMEKIKAGYVEATAISEGEIA